MSCPAGPARLSHQVSGDLATKSAVTHAHAFYIDIVQRGTLRGFTELTRICMSDLDDSSPLFFSFRSVFILYTFVFTQCSPKLFMCMLVIERSAKTCPLDCCLSAPVCPVPRQTQVQYPVPEPARAR